MSDSLISPFAAGLACRCPRCGEGQLFSGFLKVAPVCESCGLDLKFSDSGDGPVGAGRCCILTCGRASWVGTGRGS